MEKYEHSIITAIIMIIAALFGGQLFIAIGISAFWLGREHAQAEYKHIQAIGGQRADMPYFGGFYPAYWDKHSFLYDLFLPVIIAFILAISLSNGYLDLIH